MSQVFSYHFLPLRHGLSLSRLRTDQVGKTDGTKSASSRAPPPNFQQWYSSRPIVPCPGNLDADNQIQVLLLPQQALY